MGAIVPSIDDAADGLDEVALAKDTIISRSRSGDAQARCCSSIATGSTLSGATIVVILSRVEFP
jgi:hypothetical protein